MIKPLRYARGFSLLEMAMVMATLGFLMIMVFLLKGTVNNMQAATPSDDALQRGKDALAGFVVMYDRLPCPDTAGSGVENCGGAKYGGFPWRTVGLAQPLQNAHGFDLKYGVYRNPAADLANKSSAYAPLFLYLPPAAMPTPPAEWNTPVPTAYTVNVNGLDFCEKLRTAAKAGYVGSEVSAKAMLDPASRVNPAFLLADPGYTNADSTGDIMFDGVNNTGLVWESPGLPKTLTYDDQVETTSFYQLSARLSCPAIIARVSASVRDANAAYDIKRTYDFLKALRDFDKNNAQASLDIAQLHDYIADFDIALNIASSALDIGITLGSVSGAVAGAISIANGVIAVGMAIAGKVLSAQGVTSAQTALTGAIQQQANAALAVTAATTAFTAAITEAENRDAKGWFQ
jgi:hypothetical protein